MIKVLRVAGRPLVIAVLVASSLAVAGAPRAHAGSRLNASPLPLSPLSTGFLVAQAIHSGAIQLPARSATSGANPQLTCSPAPCVLPNTQASEGGQPVNEDPIAANPANSQQWLTGGNDYNCTSLQGFFTTGDAGSTWARSCMPTLRGLIGEGDPVVGYDLQGTAYRAGIDANSSVTTGVIAFQKSTDNGATWSPLAVAVRPILHGLADKPWLQIDTNATSAHSNTVYISVTQFDSSGQNEQISVSHSSDGGATWTTTAVAPEQLSPSVDQFSDLAIGKDGTVYVSWMRCKATGPTGDCGGTTAAILAAKSTDGGNTWSKPVLVTLVKLTTDSAGCYYGCLPNTGERVSEIPAIDVDNSAGSFAGHLYVVSYTWTGTQMRVQVSASSDGGATWGTPVAVAPASATKDQFLPWLTVSAGGLVGVTWLDRRADPTNISYKPFAAISANGGASFSTNVPLAGVASNPNNDGFNGTFMGDYTGNTWANATTLIASWMDTRSRSTAQDEVGGIIL